MSRDGHGYTSAAKQGHRKQMPGRGLATDIAFYGLIDQTMLRRKQRQRLTCPAAWDRRSYFRPTINRPLPVPWAWKPCPEQSAMEGPHAVSIRIGSTP